MKKQTQAAIFIVLFGAFMIGCWWLFSAISNGRAFLATRDGGKVDTIIRFAGDSYVGYFPIDSVETKKLAAKRGIGIEFTRDNGDIAERVKKFLARESDIICMTVNSFLQFGIDPGFNGVVIGVIAESNGADGIVGFSDRFKSGKVQELNDAGLKIAYMADTPNEFMLDLTIADFGLSQLRSSNDWRVKVNSPDETLSAIKNRTADAFVMWEPELSKALQENPNLKLIWSSDKFHGYVMDVFVVHQDFLRRHEKEVLAYFDAYYTSLRNYANSRSLMIDDLMKSTGLKKEVVETMMAKLNWYDLEENGRLAFGLQTNSSAHATEGLVNTILACQNVLRSAGKINGDPLKGNPYQVISSNVVKELVKTSPAMLGSSGVTVEFSAVDEAAWQRFREIGPLRVEPITFQTGADLLDESGKAGVDAIASLLINQYPQYRVAVRGHTGPGDAEENKKLSLGRAEVVVQYLKTVHGLDANRIHAEGLGATQPPQRIPNESTRAHQYRMPRVEFVLIEGNSL